MRNYFSTMELLIVEHKEDQEVVLLCSQIVSGGNREIACLLFYEDDISVST